MLISYISVPIVMRGESIVVRIPFDRLPLSIQVNDLARFAETYLCLSES